MRQWLAALLIACLLGTQFVGVAHRLVHGQTPASPLALLASKAQATHAHDHGQSWIVELAESACLHGDDCAAIDHLLSSLALAAAALIIALIAARHAQAALLALARACARPITQRSRGPPR
jgi:disulfide bond formation protein DsbB